MNSINALLELPLDETYSTILQNICQAVSSANSIKLKNAIMSLDNNVLKKTAIMCYKIIQKNEESDKCLLTALSFIQTDEKCELFTVHVLKYALKYDLQTILNFELTTASMFWSLNKKYNLATQLQSKNVRLFYNFAGVMERATRHANNINYNTVIEWLKENKNWAIDNLVYMLDIADNFITDEYNEMLKTINLEEFLVRAPEP